MPTQCPRTLTCKRLVPTAGEIVSTDGPVRMTLCVAVASFTGFLFPLRLFFSVMNVLRLSSGEGTEIAGVFEAGITSDIVARQSGTTKCRRVTANERISRGIREKSWWPTWEDKVDSAFEFMNSKVSRKGQWMTIW